MQKVDDIHVDLFRCFQFTGPCQSTLGTQSHIHISIAHTGRGGENPIRAVCAEVSSIWQKCSTLTTECWAITKLLGFISYFYGFRVHPTEIKRQCSGCRYIHLKYFLVNKNIGFNECKRSHIHVALQRIVILGGFVDNECGVQYHSKPSFINED